MFGDRIKAAGFNRYSYADIDPPYKQTKAAESKQLLSTGTAVQTLILHVWGQNQSSCFQQLCRHLSSVLVDRIKAATLYRYSCVDIDPLYKGTGSKQHLTTGTVVQTLILYIRGQDQSSFSGTVVWTLILYIRGQDQSSSLQQVQLCRH